MREVPKDLPGADLVASGIEALRRGQLTVEALLVAVGAHRLRSAGLSVPRTPELPNSPELALYSALGATHPRDTHSRYNSLIRRLVSFQRALELRSRCRRDPALKRSHAASVRGSRHLVPGRRSQKSLGLKVSIAVDADVDVAENSLKSGPVVGQAAC